MSSLRNRLNRGLAAILAAIFACHWLAADFVIRHVAENEMFTRLEHDSDSLTATLGIDGEGRLAFDARHVGLIYEQTYSGHYFLVQLGGQEFRSPSMGQGGLAVRHDLWRYHTEGPDGQPLLALTRTLVLQNRAVTLTVAEDLTEIGHEIGSFRLGYLALSVLVLLIAIALQSGDVRRALRPLAAVRVGLQAVGRGEKTRIDAPTPDEILPLVEEVNRLLALVERRMQQSRNAIGNLAHALKTPLSVLFHAASNPAISAHPELARHLGEQTEAIRQRIEVELKRARLAGNAQPGAGFNPKVELAALARLLEAMYPNKHLQIAWSAPDRLLPYDREDMLEAVGNLADNACKWARSKVAIGVECGEEGFLLTVADDGPGCPEPEMRQLARRGLRLDEAQPGHGLGLAIVRDIADFYGGSLRLGRSKALGGLEAVLRL